MNPLKENKSKLLIFKINIQYIYKYIKNHILLTKKEPYINCIIIFILHV